MNKKLVTKVVLATAAVSLSAAAAFNVPGIAATAPSASPSSWHEEAAKDSGTGRFTPTYVPAGFSKVSENTDDFPIFEAVNGVQTGKIIHRYGRVVQYSNVGSAQRAKNASDASGAAPSADVRDIFIVVVPRDSSSVTSTSTTAPGQAAKSLALRGRQGTEQSQAGTTSVRWQERSSLDIQVTGNGVSSGDVENVAKSLREDS